MTEMNDLGKAFADGWDARENGKHRTDAVLINGEEERKAWLEGWDAANKDTEDPHDQSEDREARWTDGGLSIFTVTDDQGRTVQE